ncbi:predicted protein [Thalassiosira pseudonana CCMP1335]|uniref:ATPase of the ABC class C-terminal domain-containing protein n=1 Tax=Thalassiosira pseudonana TaxID=35128 RepID=B8CED6_THAPS|nr:predicted protein [Thalassiosira pseudonana CCMP1335]EED88361.1 predicted protein [Thalassiosira pseudonana CCMP1335]
MAMASSPASIPLNPSNEGWSASFHAFESDQFHEHHHHAHDDEGATNSSSSTDANGKGGGSITSSGAHGNNLPAGGTSGGLRAVEGIISASIPLAKLYTCHSDAIDAFTFSNCNEDDEDKKARRASTVALADYAARRLSRMLALRSPFGTPSISTINDAAAASSDNIADSSPRVILQTLSQAKHSTNETQTSRRQRRVRGGNGGGEEVPFVLERSDCFVVNGNRESTLQFFLHATIPKTNDTSNAFNATDILSASLSTILRQLQPQLSSNECFAHVATVVLQCRLRGMLQPPRHGRVVSTSNNDTTINSNSQTSKYLNAVAFLANSSLLPRKSGRSVKPMHSPPAVPFTSPKSEQLERVVNVEVGMFWRQFLRMDGSVKVGCGVDGDDRSGDGEDTTNNPTTVTMRGMIIPQGVTLIVGGGYHGKSTMLQALSVGVYDKIPGDGRERCVTHGDAVMSRAEDGRGGGVKDATKKKKSSSLDTTQFSTKDASGSTSQAANVMEALESRASALLVDEDVSAANFMARDGRMRAMIMDEPITPLLYRVNGLYLSKKHNVSTVVVVGGVGEWLDVADAVVLMKDYVAYDGLKKAQSVSYQFSYGHVQYGGRGVVHRLPWEVKEEKRPMVDNTDNGDNVEMEEEENAKPLTLSPLRRRPETSCIEGKFRDAAVHLLESRLWFYPDDGNQCRMDDCGDEDDGIVDMSKCSQLVGNASEQLYGCGICILWLLQASQRHPEEDLLELLHRLDHKLNDGGINALQMQMTIQLCYLDCNHPSLHTTCGKMLDLRTVHESTK